MLDLRSQMCAIKAAQASFNYDCTRRPSVVILTKILLFKIWRGLFNS